MKNKNIEVPTSAADDNKNQSISSADQKGNVIEAQPVADAGIDSGVGHFEGLGCDIRFVKEKK
jgi:hypothetical protein